ncbi:MAG: rhodanese-like domain-containing protein [Bdellovibrionales bacterium]|nr:rhodanese-like domain-containing protein [Bdellovibrionales bacterium]
MTLVDFYNLHPEMAANEVILDVRGPEEYAEGHMPNALNIPVDQVTARAEELKKFSKVYIHCKRGGRAKRAYEALGQTGLDNLVCIHDGGMDMWIENGYPVEK